MSMSGEERQGSSASGGDFVQLFRRARTNVSRAIVGVDDEIDLVLCAMLAPGHVLLEANPGTGKTQLARSLARTFGLNHQRIQFTPDLLPSDVTGVNVWSPGSNRFDYHEGPVFTNVLLADEINRASPKTQSALLEVMEEGTVTVDGATRHVGDPFLVLATQNPYEMSGTYRLPEAQLDRFLIRVRMPVPEIGPGLLRLLTGPQDEHVSESVEAALTPSDIVAMRSEVARITVTESIARYVYELAHHIRENRNVRLGVSIRGVLAMLRIARVRAAAAGRSGVDVDDIQALAGAVFEHRIVLDPDAAVDEEIEAEDVVEAALQSIPVPTTRGPSISA